MNILDQRKKGNGLYTNKNQKAAVHYCYGERQQPVYMIQTLNPVSGLYYLAKTRAITYRAKQTDWQMVMHWGWQPFQEML